jgi:hypothetical protein
LPAESLAAQFSLSTSTSIPFPTATLATADDARAFLQREWPLQTGRKKEREANIDFVNDPFPGSPTPGSTKSNASGPVLRVSYPANTFSANPNSGVEVLTHWDAEKPFLTMMLTYEAAFDSNFDWVKGGKMPGLRGGDPGCTGGSQPTGADCFTARMMWRRQAAGEGRSISAWFHIPSRLNSTPAYVYIPTPNDVCSDNGVECNRDFGTSIERGSFTWASGR